jgi:glycosyltransferase involved in cell wall biosynthesis
VVDGAPGVTEPVPILLLAYFYPPSGGSASLRAEKLVKYLPQFGVQPVVLSAHGARYPVPADRDNYGDVVYAAARGVPPPPRWLKRLFGRKKTQGTTGMGGSVQSGSGWEKVLDFLLIPDARIGWLPGCVAKGVELVRHRKLSAIISTAPPYTSHIAGALISRLTGVPLLLDYRDAWSQNPFKRPPTALHKEIGLALERWCGHSAQAISGVTEPMVRDLQVLLGDKPLYRHIPNGYDEEDFAGQPPPPTAGPLKIVYAGTFYGSRRPDAMFQAMQELAAEGSITPGDLQVILLGDHPMAVRAKAHPSIAVYLQWLGPQNHARAVQEMATAHVNWLVIGSGIGAETTATGKLYEYLRAPGQILAQVPPGVAADIIRKHDAGIVVNPDDVASTKAALLKMLELHSGGRSLHPRTGDITRYSREKIAGQMAELIKLVC